MTIKEDFVHLHVHSDYSQLDGCGKVADYAQRAKDMGHPAIALTEHGTMRQYYTQQEACQERGIKPIYGIEFYVANDMRRKGLTDDEKTEITRDLKRGERKGAIKEYEEREGIRDRWHLTVWAQNDVGMKNLFKLSTNAWLDGFYYKPRIDVEELLKYKDGLLVATGCQSSIIMDHACLGKRKRALKEADRLYEAFGDKLWLEVMPHAGNDQILANKFAMELMGRWKNIDMVATQDAHYVDASDSEAHEVLLCIGTGDKMKNPDRFRFGDGELYLKSRKEMFRDFTKNHDYMGSKLIKRALNNTLVVSNIIDEDIVKIDRFACLMPPVDVPSRYNGDEYAYVKAMCVHGWEWREIPSRVSTYAKKHAITYKEAMTIYKSRLKHELQAIQKQKFITYFLLVRDLYDWARKQDIMCGPGRGSAAGSFVAYLLGITSVDPIEHALLFERFINPARVDMPDIDMDFEDVRRQEIIEYLRQKYGADRVSQIATVSQLSGKQCLKDISRVLEIPYADVNEVTNSIIERSSGDERVSQTIVDSFKDFKVCREFNKKYPDVLKYARKLEGMHKNLGIHAAGVVTSPVPLVDITPLEVRKHADGDVVVTAVDMNGVQAHGLLKMDVLGLRTLAVLKDAVRAIKERHNVVIDLERLDLNLADILQAFTAHDYVGIFQYDSPGADKICTGVSFDTFEDVAAMTALNRPGTARSGLATEYVDRKKHPEKRTQGHFHPKVSAITADTMGVIVYQEHVQRIFTDIAGFPPGTADSLRKKIAKKFGDETIGKERENFIRGAREHSGIDEKIAGKIMDAITFFGCLKCDTMISTPSGLKRIDHLRDGDAVYSYLNGKLVVNTIKSVGISGVKKIVLMDTTCGTVFSTLEHWWRNGFGEYIQTKKLNIGDKLEVVNVYNGRMYKGNIGKRIVRPALPTKIQKRKNGIRKSCWFNTQQNKYSWQRVEKRSGQDASINRGAIRKDLWFKKSFLGGWPYIRIQKDKKRIIENKQNVPTLWLQTIETPSAKYEISSRPPYRQESKKQRIGEFRGVVPIMPFVGTYGRQNESRFHASVKSITYVGLAETWDMECVNEPNNYVLANGLISHNSYGFNKSHATSYGVIAYWGMYLKVNYPLEFYWALLKNTPERIRIQAFAKDAKRHGIELLPPDVSVSRREFAIDPARNAIRGSLVDIKGVGEAASQSIMDNQPYTDLFDFLTRVERRKVHRGVTLALAKSGALKFIPNIKWFVDNIDSFWKEWNKGKGGATRAKEMLNASTEQPDYADEERQLIASRVNPLAFGKHPIDAYKDFIDKNVKVPMVMMSDESFWEDNNDKGVYICGVILEVKYNQIGDFHTGELPSESDRKKMFWGRRYANVNVEDAGGKQNRIKFDIDIFDDMRELIDAGIGTPVIVHAVPNKQFENLRAHFAIDLEGYRKKIEFNERLNVWESIIAGQHPAQMVIWKAKGLMIGEQVAEQRTQNIQFFENKTHKFTGVVLQIRFKYDKKDKLMAFFSMIDAVGNSIDCICFASNWIAEFGNIIKAGNLLSIELSRQKDIRNKRKWQYFFNGGNIHWYKNHPKNINLGKVISNR
jgi:DNA-directed DNA polymerase III PolC